MMDFVVNGDELAAMSGLPHIQQLTYLRGIRPYMDVKTGVTGIKRRVSYQSIAEQLYIEPHQGVRSQGFSRDQVRRAVSGLARVGMIDIQSEGKQLILKCLLAPKHFYVQNKAAINPPQKDGIKEHNKSLVNTAISDDEAVKADTAKGAKAAIPHKEDNYIYLLRHFEQFWRMYPEKKSRERAFEIFKQINPDAHLLRGMLQALDSQIKARSVMKAHGKWVPAWKYPANWLAQKCWEDEIEVTQEKRNAKYDPNNENTTADPFWRPEPEDKRHFDKGEHEQNNVINLQCYRQS